MSLASDTSPSAPLIDGAAPLRSAAPSSEEACVAAIRDALADHLAAVPVGGGSAIEQGNTLANPRWTALRTSNLRGLEDYSPDDMVVTAGAGTTLAELQSELGRHGQFLPMDVPQPDTATLGGIVATNASGFWRPAYGTPRDRLLGVRVALADGTVVRGGGKVVKNVAGYDLCKLFAGSWGTLGLITEVTFKTNPIPPARLYAQYQGENLEQVLRAALEIHTNRLDPAGMVAVCRNGVTILSVCLLGSERAVAWQAEAIEKSLSDTGMSRTDTGIEEEALRGAIVNEPGAFKARLTVRPTDLPAAAESLAGMAGLLLCHVQTGVIEAVLDLPAHADSPAFTAARRALNSAAAGRGHIVWTALPAPLKAGLDVWGTPRADHAIMRKIKQTLDPHGLFSPGRFLGRI